MRLKAKEVSVLVFVIVLALLAFYTSADPGGPQIGVGSSERASTNDGVAVEAQAGNVTALTLNFSRITERWQGYYGNVTGTILLDDANDNSLYSWHVANPEGEVFAANGTVTSWSEVFCFNFSNNMSDGQNVVQRFNGTDVERTLGMNPGDADGVDETFNQTFTGTFTIGNSVTIDRNSGCSLVSLNVNDASDNLNFNETLLTDNSSLIYTTILEQDATGFSGSTLDFQLIVGENGDDSEATTYYFYAELS